MFVADAHCDTLYRLAISDDLQKGVPEAQGHCAVSAETLAAGHVGLQTFALFTGRTGPAGTPYLDALKMIRAAAQVDVPILTKALPADPPKEPSGIFSCEGGEMLEGSLARLDEFQSRIKLRIITLTWNHENEIGYPAAGGSSQGLKPFGISLLRKMGQYGILADTSHLNDAGFWDVCEYSALPPIASHSNCRWLCNVPRNLTKEQVKALIDRNGFIGVNFYSRFLKENGKTGIDDVVRHIDALCEAGAEHIIGFGSDFDGIESWPEGLGSPANFPDLLEALSRRGYSQEQLEGIAGMNFWNLLKRVEV
ncbi:MAG: membrane dipeptidase [Parasporobacterium sp.]|nr:membrane dipeptidase [Parasporobacterium sp.]MBQ9032057.1 membrane dipeptidase [Parasporobacterium sp.]